MGGSGMPDREYRVTPRRARRTGSLSTLLAMAMFALSLAVGALALAVVAPSAHAGPSTGSIAGTVTNASLTGLAGLVSGGAP